MTHAIPWYLTRGEGSCRLAAAMSKRQPTEEMIRWLARCAVIARQQVQAFKPVLNSLTT